MPRVRALHVLSTGIAHMSLERREALPEGRAHASATEPARFYSTKNKDFRIFGKGLG